MFSTAKLSASLASIPSADNRHRHFPTQFTDALGDAEARPTLSNAISLPVCFKRKLRMPSLSTSFWLVLFCRPVFPLRFFQNVNRCIWICFMTTLYWFVSLLGCMEKGKEDVCEDHLNSSHNKLYTVDSEKGELLHTVEFVFSPEMCCPSVSTWSCHIFCRKMTKFSFFFFTFLAAKHNKNAHMKCLCAIFKNVPIY